MADLKSIVQLVMDEVPGVPRHVALSALRRSLHEFCEKSGAWRVTQVATLQPGRTVIYIDAPKGGIVDELIQSSEKLALSKDEADYKAEVSRPSNKARRIEYTIVCLPKPAQDYIDDGLIERYPYTLAYGAAAKINAMPGSFAQPDKIGYYNSLFTADIRNAKTQAQRQYNTETKHVKFNKALM